MASIEQRENGFWQARIRRRGWPATSKIFRTRADCEVWARATETAMDKGGFVSVAAAERTTFSQVAKTFKADFAPHHYRGKGWEHKLARLTDRLGSYSIASLTPDRVAWYRDERLKDPDPRFKNAGAAPRISGSTVKTELDLLSKVLDVASKEFRIPLPFGNPVASIRKPAGGPARDRRLNDEDYAKLIEACGRSSNTWLKPAVELSVETAMRQGELLSLRWDDIDTAKRVAYLHAMKTKNGDGRAVPLSSRAVGLMKALPRPIDGRVIPLEKQGLHAVFKTACKRAGLIDYRWHDLRHEALSRLAARGDLSVLELAAISGHRAAGSLRMLQVYVQLHASKLAAKLG